MKFDLRLKAITVFFLLLTNFRAFSQPLTFNKVSLPVGGYGLLMGGIAQDKNGYMWFATGAGLCRYDGYKFKTYLNDPSNPNSIASNHLEMVYVASNGLIWIATWTLGLDCFDPATGIFTHFRHNPNDSSSISDDYVRAILEDHEGILWIGTHGGLDRFEPESGKFLHYRNNPKDSSSLSCDRVRALYEDRAGTIWVGTGSVWDEGGIIDVGGLNRLDKRTGKFTRYMHDPENPHSLINNKVRAIFEDSQGIFWVGTAEDGLHTMDRLTGKFERHGYDPAHPEKLSRPQLGNGQPGPDHITFITEDAVGFIWIGTLGNGISRYDKKNSRIVHYGLMDSPGGSNPSNAWSVCNSRDGNLWIGSFEGMLYRIDPVSIKIPHISCGSATNAFMEEPSNVLWIGTDQGLIVQNRKTQASKKFVHEAYNPQSLSSSFITSMHKDVKAKIWIGTGNGLNQFNSRTKAFVRYQNNLNNSNSVSAGPIFEIADNGGDSLWIATTNGLDLMSKENASFAHFRHDPADSNSLSENGVNCLMTDKSGNLWIGTFPAGGLNYLDKGSRKFKHFLNGLAIVSLREDADGALWVGTDVGLFKKARTAGASGFIKYVDSSSNIEATGVIASIQEDNQKNLWICGSPGIYKINSKTNQTTIFGAGNGVNGFNLNHDVSYKGEDGEIYFGDTSGYYLIYPDQLRINLNPPEIIFQDLLINGRSVKPGLSSPLALPIEQVETILLAFDQNSIAIQFGGIHYSNTEYNRHIYMLQGFDTAWRAGNFERTASYMNLPPGEYVFRAKAANSDGVWAERDLKITITPPWWKRWWAYLLYAIILAVTIFIFDRVQRRRIISKERERTRARELAQAQEIEKAYHELKATQTQLIQSEKMASLGELTAGIAHEIQNPLNFVNNFSEVNSELIDEMNKEIEAGNMAGIKNIAGDLKTNMEKITNHGRRADSIVKSMLLHSRTSSGQKELTDLNALADEYLRLAYHGLRAKDQTINAQIKMDFDGRIGKINIVPQDIGRVLLNLYNNAFYAVTEKKKLASPEYQPTVSVSTKKTGEKIEIHVADNGNGIPQKIADKIFQPFFTSKPTGQGTGLGLSLSYDIIKAHGGEIKVESKQGDGAEFVIQLPIV